MTESASNSWRPSKVTLIGAACVVIGFLACGISWWFLLLSGLGAFGPGLLRELELVDDRDEFQRRADQRAGYHAFLVAGFAACALVAWFRSGERLLQNPQELATLFLCLLWFSWLLSSLVSYWGARKAAARILIVFGLCWFGFAILANTGSEWGGWTALLLHPLIALPFLVLAKLSSSRPRLAGGLLFLVAAFFVWFFRMFRGDAIDIVTQGVTFILFIGPLLASAVALVVYRGLPGHDV